VLSAACCPLHIKGFQFKINSWSFENLIFTSEGETSYYQFENLANCKGITHRIYTRTGGFSGPPFAGLNVTFGIGDDDVNVRRNREIISRGMEADALVFARQVHGSQVAVLTRDNRGLDNRQNEIFAADAVVSDRRRICLVIQVADCQAVMLHEPNRNIVANVHSGWRGSVQNIVGQTVETMEKDFDCNPGLIQAGIGPSLGPCCAEFVNYKDEIPQKYWRYGNSSSYFDFWAISRDQLLQAGIPAENIECSQLCTRCRTDEFFSYRAEKKTGRFAAVIGLK
jgi:YfiH family protein